MPKATTLRGVENFAGRSLLWIGLPTIILLCSSLSVWAQSPPLTLGSVTHFVDHGQNCPGEPIDRNPRCYEATVDYCPASSMSTLMLPSVTAIVAISKPSNWNNGTIVLFGGSSGSQFFSKGYGEAYFDAGFQVVQIAWQPNTWRDNIDNPTVKRMKYEGCRPATLLKYLYDHRGSSTGAMCAQGHSTGATALAFALAWYGAGSYLDNVVLTSGPPQADLRAGCQFPKQLFPDPIEVCPSGKCIASSSWTDCTQYLKPAPNDLDCANVHTGETQNAAQSVAQYTNDPAGNCNAYNGNQDTSAFDQNWFDMSVISDNASYSYPHTSVYAFLCSRPTGANPGETQNNSAAQAWLYLDKLISGTAQLRSHGFYRVDHCSGNEEIWNGVTLNDTGFHASASAMVNQCVP